MMESSLGPAACGHPTPAVGPPVCAHLRDRRDGWLSYNRCYTGAGFAHLLLCIPCADEYDAGRPLPVFQICEDCLEFATSEVGDLTGVRGRPEVLEQAEAFDATLHTFDVPPLDAPLIDLAPADALRRWYGLCADGTIVLFSTDWATAGPVATAPLVDEPDRTPWTGHTLRRRLHMAPSGRFAAMANDYGRFGVVVDVESNAVTMRLDGGEYYPETVPFSLALAALGEHEVVVHRTSWNRLDVSDPASGELLTDRPSPTWSPGRRPEHGLDYFHGRLYLSPDGTRLLDDGWVWHPVGIPEAWDLGRWLSENVWESEDGPSKVSLGGRAYYWDHGMCWIDSQRVALEGIGSDDIEIIAGARIFDVTEESASRRAKELLEFPGPTGQFFSDGTRLFSADPAGLSIWKLATGARTGRIAGFTPQYHARAAGELVELRGDEVVVWRHR